MTTSAQIRNDSPIQLKLLIDTGAALSLLLHTYSTPELALPQPVIKGNIGTGLGGEIEGYVGRIKSLYMGKNKLVEPISNFQELNALSDSAYINGRNGLIGGEILWMAGRQRPRLHRRTHRRSHSAEPRRSVWPFVL